MELQLLNNPNGIQDVRFIESNTKILSFQELKNHHIIPVFVKDNEQIIAHQELIETTQQAALEVFDQIGPVAIRVSHPVKGRVPSARGKRAIELLDEEKTIYYERMAFLFEIPDIIHEVNGQELKLCIGGVRALNQENLYSHKGIEKFKVFIGFKVKVCTNLCVSTDGFSGVLRVSSIEELLLKVKELFNQFQVEKSLQQYTLMQQFHLTEEQFAFLIGRAKMYAFLPKHQKLQLPEFSYGDNQLNQVIKAYYEDPNFRALDSGHIDLWRLFNLFTGANKSSYIDTFIDRSVHAYHFIHHLQEALAHKKEHWFLID